MASHARPEDDLLMDDFLFQESDPFALPLLDFDPDGALLTPTELAISQTLPFPDGGGDDSSSSSSFQPTSPVSTDDGSTDAEVSSPLPAFAQHQQLPQFCAETDVASSPAAKVSLLGSTASMHSPLPSDQKLLAPRNSSNNTNNNNISSAMTPTNAAKPMQPKPMMPMLAPTPFPGVLPYAMPVAYFPPLNASQKRPCPQVLPGATTPNAATPLLLFLLRRLRTTRTPRSPSARSAR